MEEIKNKVLEIIQKNPNGISFVNIYREFAPNPKFYEILNTIKILQDEKKIEFVSDGAKNKLRPL